MLNFLLGLIVGAILGVAYAAILSAGAIADEKRQRMWKNFNQHEEAEQNSLILKP